MTEPGIGENGDHPAVATAVALAILEKPAGYGWIFYPPELSRSRKPSEAEFQGGRLDLVRLLVEWLILLVATGASVYGLADERQHNRISR